MGATVQTKLETLTSIEDLLGLLGTKCRHCAELDWPGRYIDVSRDDKTGEAVFHCSFDTLIHEHRVNIGFETPPEEIQKLAEGIKELIKERPGRSASEARLKLFIGKYDTLSKKLQIYARFAPKDFVYELEGLCHYCGRKVNMTIRDRTVWYGCSECASILADTYSG